jgi:hypothetical protein
MTHIQEGAFDRELFLNSVWCSFHTDSSSQLATADYPSIKEFQKARSNTVLSITGEGTVVVTVR